MAPIPLFPLNTVLMPGMPLPLRVFEPRYRAMMADLLGDDVSGPEGGPPPRVDGELPSFGVARIREGLEVGGRAGTHDVGVIAAIEWVVRRPDGTIELLARGTRRFRIEHRPADDPYPRAEVTILDETAGPGADHALRFARSALTRYVGAVAQLLRSEPEQATLPDDPIAASYAFAAALTVEPSVMQALLEAPNATERLVRTAAIARAEANLLTVVGPPARRPTIESASLN
ncbi:MAG: LON peptidase substrate-binding domain-containing protein [Actinomycetota bacterium]